MEMARTCEAGSSKLGVLVATISINSGSEVSCGSDLWAWWPLSRMC